MHSRNFRIVSTIYIMLRVATCRVLRDRYQLRPRLRGVRYDIV